MLQSVKPTNCQLRVEALTTRCHSAAVMLQLEALMLPAKRKPDLSAAADFIWRNARLLERHVFTHLFLGGDKAPVLEALRPYQNSDGGFGNGLEPDIRGPVSQPVPVEIAFRTLDQIDAFTEAAVMVAKA